MNPGDLNRQIVIQKLIETKDAEGNLTPDYTDRKTTWANVVTLTAKSVNGSIEKSFTAISRFKMRYDADILYTDRIKYGTRIFYQSAPPVNLGERNTILQLECEEFFEVQHG